MYTFKLVLLVFSLGFSLCVSQRISRNVEIADQVYMPRISLGTCCGSEPKIGLESWLAAGGTGIDTAYDYGKSVPGGLQTDIRDGIAKSNLSRNKVFITTKIPAGIGYLSGFCIGGKKKALDFLKRDLQELGVDQVDLVLLHAPCLLPSNTRALWEGLEEGFSMNLTRAIGVSNFNTRQLKKLLETARIKPAVNQCSMSVQHHDEATINYCKSKEIQYEAYSVLKGCPFTDPLINSVAQKYNVTSAQVCIRWTLQRGVIMALGTGKNPDKVAQYARQNLEVYDFELTRADMVRINALEKQKSKHK